MGTQNVYFITDLFTVRNVWVRQELLVRTIGPRDEETLSYNNSVLLLTWVLIIFLSFSLLELVSFLAYEYWVNFDDCFFVNNTTTLQFHPWREIIRGENTSIHEMFFSSSPHVSPLPHSTPSSLSAATPSNLAELREQSEDREEEYKEGKSRMSPLPLSTPSPASTPPLSNLAELREESEDSDEETHCSSHCEEEDIEGKGQIKGEVQQKTAED